MMTLDEFRQKYPQYDDMPDRDVVNLVHQKFYPDMPKAEFVEKAQVIDKKSGAPAKVRMMVGSAPAKDRLASIKQFYPDAEPFGEDNFIFTEPRTGRATLYNPKGLDAGDVASVAREGAQAVGSGMGAVVGGTAGGLAGLAGGPAAPATVPGGAVVGASYGAGVGSAVAGSLFDIARNLAGGTDTRNVGERLTDTALDFGAAAVGQRAGEIVGDAATKAVTGGKNVIQSRLQDFKSVGITNPPAGAVSGSRAIQGAEKALLDMPASANIMETARDRVLGQVKQAADDLVSEIGEAKTKQGAGEVIRTASKEAISRIEARVDTVYEKAFDLVGADTKVSVDAVKKLGEALKGELAKAPKSMKDKLGGAIREIDDIVSDAGEEGLSFSALRAIRTAIGKNLKQSGPQATGAQNASMKLVYGALTDDMSAAAKAAGPDAAQALSLADRYTRFQMQKTVPLLKKIVEFDADEKAFNFAMSAAKDGGSNLAKLRRNFKPEEWDTVAATVLNKIGMAKPGAQDAAGDTFSINTFLTNWSTMSQEAKAALFAGSRYKDIRPALDAFVRNIGALKETERLTNTSGTGRQLAYQAVLSALGGGAGLAAGGDIESAGAGVAGAVIAPWATAKLITNPAFTRWLANLGATNVNGMIPQLARLAAIGQAEPAIKEEVTQLLQAMRAAP